MVKNFYLLSIPANLLLELYYDFPSQNCKTHLIKFELRLYVKTK